eukprot:RCo031554
MATPPEPSRTSGLVTSVVCAASVGVGAYSLWVYSQTRGSYCETQLAGWILAFGIWQVVSGTLTYLVKVQQRALQLRGCLDCLSCASLALYISGLVMLSPLPWTGYLCPPLLVTSVRAFFLAFFILACVQLLLCCAILCLVALASSHRSPAVPAR